jgi:hypothetical protein
MKFDGQPCCEVAHTSLRCPVAVHPVPPRSRSVTEDTAMGWGYDYKKDYKKDYEKEYKKDDYEKKDYEKKDYEYGKDKKRRDYK